MTLQQHAILSSASRDGARLAGLSRKRRLAFVAGTVLLLSAASGTALADVAVLGSDRIGSGRAERPALQLVQTQQNSRAREQAIIWRLEEEIRRLNGRIEELEFNQRQTENRLNQFIEDWEQRTVASESGNIGPGGPLVLEQTTRSPEDAIKELAELSARQPDDGSLGSVAESAVAGLPRPNPADVAAPERSTISAEQQYEDAVQLLQSGNYKGAQNGLEVFLDVHKDHQLASNAAYWLAETHYVRQNYAAAAAAFARNYGTYGKESPKAVDNLLKLGMSLSNLGENDKACLSYDELTGSFPSMPANIEQAVNRERARAKCS